MGWVTNKFVLSKLISFAADDDDFEDENHNNHCDYYCQTYHQRWRQHCALQWLHCVHCSVFTLFKTVFTARVDICRDRGS